MIFVNGDFNLHFQGQLMTFLVPTTLPHFYKKKFGKKSVILYWDTAIFLNSNIELHFQGQMISLFCCWRDAIIVAEIFLKLIHG